MFCRHCSWPTDNTNEDFDEHMLVLILVLLLLLMIMIASEFPQSFLSSSLYYYFNTSIPSSHQDKDNSADSWCTADTTDANFDEHTLATFAATTAAASWVPSPKLLLSLQHLHHIKMKTTQLTLWWSRYCSWPIGAADTKSDEHTLLALLLLLLLLLVSCPQPSTITWTLQHLKTFIPSR